MERPVPFPPARRGFRPARWLVASAFVLAAAGCDCGSKGLKGAGPTISVDPDKVHIEGTPGHISEVILKVTNIGNGALKLEKAPAFDEKDNDGAEEYGVSSLFEKGCDEQPRPAATRETLEPGACAQLVFRYIPNGDGLDTADLHIYSNDAETPDFVVPIDAGALTPKLEVCAFDGQTELGCGAPGAAFDVDFGTAAPGSAVKRTLRLTSKGSRPVSIQGLNLTGDTDFTVDPATLTKSLANGESVDLTATFDALAGGAREGDLVISNDDPTQQKLTVRLLAVGDASRLCLCIGADGSACRPAATADFGKVPINGEGHKYLRLASCGTKPLTLSRAEITDGAPVFSAQVPNLGGGKVMAPGDPTLDIPLVFKPNAEQKFLGRFTLETESEHGYVSLVGEGIESGCKLEAASTTIDFGQVAKGVEARKDYTVANRGTTDCIIPSAPTITVGANIRFALAGFPAEPTVPPGQTVKFTVSYNPQDETGPDTGELSIPYGDASGGVATSELKVQLKGTPTALPECVIVANPGGSSTFGRTLNFGQVRTNSEKVLPVTFQNTGSSPCSLSAWRISGTALPGMPNDASSFKIKTPPKAALQPGETTSMDVAFTPTSDRAYGSALPGFPGGGNTFGVNLMVQTSDTNTTRFPGTACAGFGGSGTPGCVAWALSGQGVKSDLHALPADIDFGKVTLGCRSREEKVTLYNTGGAVITIKSIKVDPAPPPEIFKVIAPATPFTLVGGAQMSLSVRYKPPDASIHTGTIYIESDATNVSGANPYITVGLRGEGTTESHQTDTFDQASRPKTDVLFVVDNSGSMSEEQGHLAANASTFIGVAQQLNTDFQIAVVTTDMDDSRQSGKFQGNPKIIVNGSSAASQFATTVRALGTNGSSTEKGLEAMVAALTDPLINDPNANKGFLRPDAKLAVVEVSDEDDQSSGTIDFYTDFLKNIKGSHNASMVTLSSIVGDPGPNHNSSGTAGCTSPDGDAVSGDRYIAVQQRTNGKFRSICSADWGQIAADLGLDAFASRAGFPLSRPADPATIQVRVNGTLRPAADWSYDATGNTVVFNPSALPPAGATVVIDYEALCL